jgi:hypothetical protein
VLESAQRPASGVLQVAIRDIRCCCYCPPRPELPIIRQLQISQSRLVELARWPRSRSTALSLR